jgi:hypothetical protein
MLCPLEFELWSVWCFFAAVVLEVLLVVSLMWVGQCLGIVTVVAAAVVIVVVVVVVVAVVVVVVVAVVALL